MISVRFWPSASRFYEAFNVRSNELIASVLSAAIVMTINHQRRPGRCCRKKTNCGLSLAAAAARASRHENQSGPSSRQVISALPTPMAQNAFVFYCEINPTHFFLQSSIRLAACGRPATPRPSRSRRNSSRSTKKRSAPGEEIRAGPRYGII